MKTVVVGGGPVGLFAATHAAQRGHTVTVLERRDGDGDKACGEGLMPSAVAALSMLGVEPEGRSFRGIRYLDASGRHQVRADLRTGHGLGVRRTELVRTLRVAATESGVELVHADVKSLTDDGDGVSVGSDDGQWRVGLVLGCDGLGSTVRRCIGAEATARGPRRYGLVAHYAVAPWSDDVEVYWGRSGEAYVTPLGADLVGVALLGDRGGSYEDRIAELGGLRRRLDGATSSGRVLGAGPLRRRATTPVRGRVALVGDAAGYVDALTGEGLALGFGSAVAAVAAAERGDLDSYAQAWRLLSRTPTALTEVLVRASGRQRLRCWLVPSAEHLPRVFGRAVAILG